MKIIFYTDTHGHLVAEDAVSELKKSIDLYSPDVIICGGDILDLAALRNGASGNDLATAFEQDVNAAISLLKEIKPNHVTAGNHDFRAFDKAKNVANGPLRSLCNYILKDLHAALESINSQMTEYQIYKNAVNFNGVNFLHGFQHSAVNPAKPLCLSYNDAVAGHVHGPSIYMHANIEGYKAFTVPTMAEPVMPYNDRQVNTFRHRKGHALIEILDSGAWWCDWIIQDKGEWIR